MPRLLSNVLGLTPYLLAGNSFDNRHFSDRMNLLLYWIFRREGLLSELWRRGAPTTSPNESIQTLTAATMLTKVTVEW